MIESMHSLVERENRLYLVKSRNVAIRYFRGIMGNTVQVRKIYKSRKELTVFLLEDKQAKKEAEVTRVVDRCLHFITWRIEDFFAEYKVNIKKYAMEVVSRKKEIDSKWFFENVLPRKEVEKLQLEIKHEIQQELQQLFGVKSVQVAGIKLGLDEMVNHQRMNSLLNEHYNTILIAKTMTNVANRIWDECLGRIKFPSLFGKIIKNFKLGSIFTKAVQCEPECELLRCKREIEKYLTGVLMNIQFRMTQEIRKTTAGVFYTLYDKMVAAEIDKRIAELVSENNIPVVMKKRTKPLYLIKQASISR